MVASAAGWVLSAFHQLNRAGYGVVFLLLMAGGGRWWRRRSGAERAAIIQSFWRAPQRLGRRCRRLLPALFFALASLALVGAVLHPIANGDALSQRIPRVLHWLAEGRWHWIDAVSPLQNTYPAQWEWMAAPLLLFTKSDRGLFVINFISFLLLPGLVFSVFRRLGVRPRVAWSWMWVLPTGYGYLLQAGGVYNDMLGAVLALAALDFALRARASGRVGEAWLSVLAMAVLSAVKPTNLVLGLPWLIAFGPAMRLLWQRPVGTVACLAVAILVSLVPTCFFNDHYTGDWTGLKPSHPNIKRGPAAANLFCNSVILARENLLFPVFPAAGWWNREIPPRIPDWLHRALSHGAGQGRHEFRLTELAMEERTGVGFGVAWLLIASVVAGWRYRRQRQVPARQPRRTGTQWLLLLSPYVATAVFLGFIVMSTTARNLLPFYPLLLPVWLVGSGVSAVVRARWWRWSAAGVMLLAVVPLVLTPHRPLWPGLRVTQQLSARYPTNTLWQRLHTVQAAYARRWDALGPLRDWIPSEERVVGFMPLWTAGYCETSLWRPFGTRRVRAVQPTDTPEQIARKQVRYIVLSLLPSAMDRKVAGQPFDEWFPDWLQRVHGQMIGQTNLLMMAAHPPAPWAVVKLCGP